MNRLLALLRTLQPGRSPHTSVLTLHIGLPKTATTFLQKEIFRGSEKLNYIHNAERGPLQKLLERQQRGRAGKPGRFRSKLTQLMPKGEVLVSDENIVMHVLEPWCNVGPTPTSFRKRARELQQYCGTLRVILGLRRQDQWLASRYAESARAREDFSQADFERRIWELAAGPAKGSLQWLDYDVAHEQLCRAVGESNVLLMPMELVDNELETATHRLQEFMGESGWFASFQEREREGKVRRRNVLSRGENAWKLRGHRSQLLLPTNAQRAILTRYREGNQRISDRLSLNLDRFDYF